MASAAYPIITWTRQPLNGATREELLQEGKARALVATSFGLLSETTKGAIVKRSQSPIGCLRWMHSGASTKQDKIC
jgi:hypothetical protein